jgi:hypothetical protein
MKMTKNYGDELTDWWDKLGRANEPLRNIMMRQWDDTGRSTREIRDSYIELLELAKDDHQTFRDLYKEFLGELKAPSILEVEADTFYAIYMHGKMVGVTEFAAELKEGVFGK